MGLRRLYAAPLFGGATVNHFSDHSPAFRIVVADLLSILEAEIEKEVRSRARWAPEPRTESAAEGEGGAAPSVGTGAVPRTQDAGDVSLDKEVDTHPDRSIDDQPGSVGEEVGRRANRRSAVRQIVGVWAAGVAVVLVVVGGFYVAGQTTPVLVPPPAGTLTDTIAESGWGPSRTLFSAGERTDAVSINSVSDSAERGFEPNFATARAAAASNEAYADQLAVRPGEEYVAYAAFSTTASQEFPSSVAENTRVRAELPAVLRGSGVVNIFFSSPSASPLVVWDGFSIALPAATDQAVVRLVPGSATLHSGGVIDGASLDDTDLLSKEGAPLGCSALDGRIPPGAACAGFVTFRFVVDQPDFDVTVSARKSNTDEPFTTAPAVSVGDKLDLLIEYRNTGSTTQRNVTLESVFSSQSLTYVNGTARIANASTSGAFSPVGDELRGSGLAIGDYTPGSNAYVGFEAIVTNTEAGSREESRWVTEDSLARVTTSNGVKSAGMTFLLIAGPPEVRTEEKRDESSFWSAQWGPQREMFTVESGGPLYPAFNSILDNPYVGDERNFVGLRLDTEADVPNVWSDDVWGRPGDTFVARLYFHNAGPRDGGPAESLQQARARMGISRTVDRVSVFGELSAVNAASVWDGATVHLDEGSELVVNEDSAKLENNANGPLGRQMSSEIFGRTGTQVGYSDLDGVIPAGYDYAGYITFEFSIQQRP